MGKQFCVNRSPSSPAARELPPLGEAQDAGGSTGRWGKHRTLGEGQTFIGLTATSPKGGSKAPIPFGTSPKGGNKAPIPFGTSPKGGSKRAVEDASPYIRQKNDKQEESLC